jgi:hypothetical protein
MFVLTFSFRFIEWTENWTCAKTATTDCCRGRSVYFGWVTHNNKVRWMKLLNGNRNCDWHVGHTLKLHTYIPLTLYLRRGSRGISNIPPRHPRFTKIRKLWGTLQTWQGVSPSPSYCSLSQVSANNPLVAFYDIHGGKTEVLFFYFVPDTPRECFN